MFLYQKRQRYFAKVSLGIESLAEAELKSLGASEFKQEGGGFSFSADSETLYRINYMSRLIIRVLAPLVSFKCQNRNDLYRTGKSIDWLSCFEVTDTFAVYADVKGNDEIRHSKFAALCLKDAIVDYFREKKRRRPNVDSVNPDVWLNLHIEGKNATISLDTSGGSLHKRGYRKRTVDAPIQETIAAAMVALSGWEGQKPLYDPMCGSGTLLCEALMSYCRIPANFFKSRFGFYFLPDFNRRLWNKTRKDLDKKVRALPFRLIGGSDIDKKAMISCAENLKTLPGSMRIKVIRKDFKHLRSLEESVILCNPPYGLRIKTEEALSEFYKKFGDFLKQRCKGSEAYIFFGNREMLKHIGLKPAFKKAIKNAGLDGRIAKYELF